MSLVPFDQLKEVTSLQLKVYNIQVNIEGEGFVYFDSFTERMAFWRSITIRNFGDNQGIFYRQDRSSIFDVIPPLSERVIGGWGSFIELRAPDGDTMRGIAIAECVNVRDAGK